MIKRNVPTNTKATAPKVAEAISTETPKDEPSTVAPKPETAEKHVAKPSPRRRTIAKSAVPAKVKPEEVTAETVFENPETPQVITKDSEKEKAKKAKAKEKGKKDKAKKKEKTKKEKQKEKDKEKKKKAKKKEKVKKQKAKAKAKKKSKSKKKK